jgi:transposase
LRLAAPGVANRPSALGASERRRRARLGAPKAMPATAPKRARLVSSRLRYGTAYVDAGQQAYDHKDRERGLTHLPRTAKAFGSQLVHGEDTGSAQAAATL